jgi:LysR family hydrogen peroxide-inducible transcriptional activator
MPSITQLEYVLAVDKYRHFGKAADASHVTQPTLSMQLQKLEEELGVSLFDRSKKPILPTSAGIILIEQARRVLLEYKKIPQLMQNDQKEISGQLKLAVIPTLAPYVIPLFLQNFSKNYPKVDLSVEELQTHQIISSLQNDEIDVGLLATPLHEKSIQEEVLFYEPFSLYVRKNHPLAKRERIHEDELDGAQMWLLKDGHCFREQMIRLCSLDIKNSILKNVHFESGNLETLKRLVELNSGYTLLPYLATQSHIDLHKASIVRFQKPTPVREVSLVFNRLHLKQNHIQALKKSIVESLPKELQNFSKKDFDVVEFVDPSRD